MRKDAILKWELFIGITFAYLMIIGTAIYFFHALGEEAEQVKAASDRIQNKTTLLIKTDEEIFDAMQAKDRYLLQNKTQDLKEIATLQKQLASSFKSLREGYSGTEHIVIEINKLEAATKKAFQINNIVEKKAASSDEMNELLLQEKGQMNDLIYGIRTALSHERQAVSQHFFTTVQSLKTTAYIFIGLPLLFILFIINRIIKVIRELSRRSKETHLLNEEIQTAKKNIEDTNWVLAEASKLNENISGIDNENLIAKAGFESIMESLQFYAGAIYIRRMDSQEFVLKQHIGVDKDHAVPPSFSKGEGLMGHIVESKEIRIIEQQADKILSSSSSLQANQIQTIILAPLVYENRTWGLLEIGGDFKGPRLKRTCEYLERVCRTLAMSIKFGQSHTMVESLLEETQQQTEELEAQQEELRITNEELIHKTHLLEASEEELRVQQEELQQANTELEEKAKQLEVRNEELHLAHKTVAEKVQEVELASKYKSEFMANMSHELRTPLNSILILAKLLQDNKTKNLRPDQVKYASVIHSAGNDLLQLINELLDLAKIEAGKVELNLDVINTSDFRNNIDNLFAATAKEKGIRFEVVIEDQVPETFVTDEYRLEQVLKNFLSNAFKFTDRNGQVQLAVRADSNNLKFTVADTGKGISPEKQQLIFEAFRQEDGSTSRKYGGTGLGLSISREIASLLGGRITLTSQLGKGSTFTLIIPCQRADSLKPAAAETGPLRTSAAPSPTATPEHAVQTSVETLEAPSEDSRKEVYGLSKTLLIVEDDINFADILREFAESYGFDVVIAYDGADGIQKARQFKPQAIILDVMLPISDGWEVLRNLKSSAETKHIPVHMMSAATFNKRESIEKGAIGFLPKPVSGDALKQVFENINLSINKSIKKVLLIEDQEFQSDIIKLAFAEQNIHTLQAFSAKSAMAKLKEEGNIDCIILDIKLPDADGLDILDQIKSMPAYEDTPIIINTAYDLSQSQIDRISQHTKAMVLKSEKSNSRLIDEVTLFLNKISSDNYSPIKNLNKLEQIINKTDSLHGKRVLIADDDMRNVYALTTILQEYHMEVDVANNGTEAVDIINDSSKKIDIVLMDIMMPEMDGYEAIENIRKQKKYAELPIIAVTAKAMKGDREKSMQIGASDYISKPIDVDKLISLMRVWLS